MRGVESMQSSCPFGLIAGLNYHPRMVLVLLETTSAGYKHSLCAPSDENG